MASAVRASAVLVFCVVRAVAVEDCADVDLASVSLLQNNLEVVKKTGELKITQNVTHDAHPHHAQASTAPVPLNEKDLRSLSSLTLADRKEMLQEVKEIVQSEHWKGKMMPRTESLSEDIDKQLLETEQPMPQSKSEPEQSSDKQDRKGMAMTMTSAAIQARSHSQLLGIPIGLLITVGVILIALLAFLFLLRGGKLNDLKENPQAVLTGTANQVWSEQTHHGQSHGGFGGGAAATGLPGSVQSMLESDTRAPGGLRGLRCC